MASRSQYWSCTGVADWIRGTPKAGAKTASGWKAWKRQAKTAHPIRFWIAEEALDQVQKVVWAVPDLLHGIKYYVNNRWVTRTHSLTAHSRDIKPGTWCDVGNRILPCLFNELVDFVEIEQAWIHVVWDEEARKRYSTPWWAVGWFRWRTWRCPQAGLDYLKWASELDNSEFLKEGEKAEPTQQAISAREIQELYHWWKNVRPLRPDPYDVSGWSNYCNRKRDASNKDDLFDFLDNENETPEERVEVMQMLDKTHEIEKQYNDQDEEMMIRLIKIRQSLWT